MRSTSIIRNFTLCLELWCFKKKPQDFPYSLSWLFIFLFSSLLLTQLIEGVAATDGSIQLLLIEGASYLLLAGYLCLLLWAMDLWPRLKQSLTTFYGVELVFDFILMIMLVLFDPAKWGGLLSLSVLMLYLWGLAVYSHIFRHTLSVSVFSGAFIAVSYEVLRLTVLRAILH